MRKITLKLSGQANEQEQHIPNEYGKINAHISSERTEGERESKW